MNRRRLRLFVGGLLLGALVGCLTLWWRAQRPRPVPVFGTPPTPKTHAGTRPPTASLAPEVLARFNELEAFTQLHDASTWAPARLAESFEEALIQWWDALRTAPDPWQVAAALAFDELILPGPETPIDPPSPGPDPASDLQIRRFTSSAPPTAATRFSHRQFSTRLRSWAAEGWQLGGSEWRMPAFDPPNPAHADLAVARAQVVFQIQLEAPASPRSPARRGLLRGTASVEWACPGARPDTARIRSLRVEHLERLERDGPPLFALVARDDVSPQPGAITIDPLLVQDLDGDGLDDIVLLGRNRVYHNRGEGRLIGLTLCPQLDAVLITGVLADMDGDGHLDLVGVDGQGLVLFRGNGGLRFEGLPERQPLPGIDNSFVLAAGDLDGDGHPDLFLAQYKVPYLFGQMPHPYYDARDSFPAFVLLNDGSGHFTNQTSRARLGPAGHRRAYAAALVDVDADGDLDLVLVSDFAGVDLLLNDGSGRFTDVTAHALPEPHLFGMALAIADFNRNDRPDILAIGMNSPVADRLDHLGLGLDAFPEHRRFRPLIAHGNRLWYNLGGGRFEAAPPDPALAATGWSWGIVAEDLLNQGDLALYVVNGHKSLASARDYDTRFWTHDIHLATSDGLDPGLDLYFNAAASRWYGNGGSYGGHQYNVLLVRDPAGRWTDIAWLLGLALPEDCRNVTAVDLDRDGRLDLVVTLARFHDNPGQEIRVYRNNGPMGHPWQLRITGSQPGRLPLGARISLHSPSGTRHRWLLTGDAYRSQRPAEVHFATRPGDTPTAFEVVWPGGSRERIPIQPGRRQYTLTPR